MAKVVRFPVYFEAVGYHELELPDDIDPDDDDAVRQFIDDHWDEVPIPEDHEFISESSCFDWDSYIEVFDE
jgi:hypothetical protein